MIPERVIQEVKERVDAVDVFGRRVTLRRSGAAFVAQCPFHEDRSPSFRVYPQQARFHCFGCGASGDVFEFLQRLDGKPFPIVVRELAAEVGIRVADDDGTDRGARERSTIADACAAALERYQEALWGAEGAAAREYLRSRGVSEATARSFRLGYAAGDLVKLAAAAGQPAVTAVRAAGLAAERDGSLVDRFRARIVLPLAGLDGRVRGFAGRSIAPADGPPWMTTAENAEFSASRVLFGLPESATAIRRRHDVLFVPRYFDVLACREAGIDNAVGGVPLDARRIALLARCGARTVRFIAPAAGCGVDPDLAAHIFTAGDSSGSLAVHVVTLPPELAGRTASVERILRASGRSAFDRLVAAAVPLSEQLIDEALRGADFATRRNVEAKLEAVARLAAYTARLPQGLSRDILERRIAQRLHITVRAMRAATRNAGGPAPVVRRRRSGARRAG